MLDPPLAARGRRASALAAAAGGGATARVGGGLGGGHMSSPSLSTSTPRWISSSMLIWIGLSPLPPVRTRSLSRL